ncbi:MAG: Co2+/Mg2+ efflux protein ApaG [Myxococcales bacterium]|nr:Co2+/Mg2+ efflux protein ApaG [Myxococcales bacterium]
MQGKSEAVTDGIRVRVESRFVPQQSQPGRGRYVFTYSVQIRNESETTVQLRTRHWVITDANERVEEVRGEGVVGEQPILKPNQTFQYTSGCILRTAWGTMGGSYRMFRPDGSEFSALISPFLLAAPFVSPAGEPS